VSAFCTSEPAIRAAYRAVAGREDDPAGSQLVIGLLTEPGTAADALMREAEQRLSPPDGVVFALTVLDPGALGAIGRYMVEHTEPVYERDTGSLAPMNRRPKLELVAPDASPEEAAAIVAALEQFMRETAPVAAPVEERKNPWYQRGLLESIEREPPRHW
jgi:hypothetical protein